MEVLSFLNGGLLAHRPVSNLEEQGYINLKKKYIYCKTLGTSPTHQSSQLNPLTLNEQMVLMTAVTTII